MRGHGAGRGKGYGAGRGKGYMRREEKRNQRLPGLKHRGVTCM